MISTPTNSAATLQFPVEAGLLRPVVAALSKVLSTKSTLPELKHIRVDPIQRDTLRLTGTDLESFLSVEVPSRVPARTGAFLVPLAQLQARLKGSRTGDEIFLRPGKIPVERFPEIPQVKAPVVKLEPAAGQALRRALACASSDESRHILQGAYLDASGGGSLRVVGTDGRHLFLSQSLRVPGLKESIVVPAHKVWKSPLLRKEAAWTLRLGENRSWFCLEGPRWSLTAKAIEGTYPNYHQVVPEASSFAGGLVIPEDRLLDLLRLLSSLPGTDLAHQTVGLRIGEGRVGLLARESETEPYEEHVIPALEVQGAPVTVFLDRRYLLRGLSFGLNRIEWSDGESPVKLSRDGELMIIMPVRCEGDVQSVPANPTWGRAVENSTRKPRTRPAGELNGNGGPREEPRRLAAQLPKKVSREAPGVPTADPVELAVRQVMQVRESLKAADTHLNQLVATLRGVSRQQRHTEKEMRAVRGTLRGLRNLGL